MKLEVVEATKSLCEEFVVKKHYSRRASIFWKGFALVDGANVCGVCVFGQPSPPIQKHAFKDRDFKLLELSRLVIQTPERNAASFLVSHSLRMLDAPCAVVSYADSEQGHCGIVYQATNWIYTGSTVSHDRAYIVEGKRVHPMTLRDKGITDPVRWAKENNVQTIKPLPKHRYFYLVGNQKQRKRMKEKMSYQAINQYPKCDQSRYDDGPTLDVRMEKTFNEEEFWG